MSCHGFSRRIFGVKANISVNASCENTKPSSEHIIKHNQKYLNFITKNVHTYRNRELVALKHFITDLCVTLQIMSSFANNNRVKLHCPDVHASMRPIHKYSVLGLQRNVLLKKS